MTNPPIDAQREEIVTSRTVYVGKNGNLLEQKPGNCHVLKINNPILTDLDLLKIENMKRDGFKVSKVSTLYYKSSPMKMVLKHLFLEVDKAYKEGANILILSDRGVDENHVAIPSLLAVAAVHKHLVDTRKCTAMSLILESGEPRQVHHFAALLGFGASAVNPYLAHATIAQLIENELLDKDYYAAVDDYDDAILFGIVKIASKMGISTIQSYQGSKIFEAIGISPEVIDEYFTGTVSRVGGITLDDIGRATDAQHSLAFDPLGLEVDLELTALGRHKSRSQGENHRYNPETIHALQTAAREGNYERFKEYTKLADAERTGYLRTLFDFCEAAQPVPLDEVEDERSIVKRFKTGAMSYGSISEEAHETLAIAMNHLQGKSNSGEGGESEERLMSAGTAHDRSSAIKQVASGRFGVTSRYLVSAKELQIKMAQGAKPGEGGHLPGKKVYPWIAKTRHSTPGVSLISPPPHHDIYSIEDLAQLIYDLKNANKNARISVKLVSEAGVGTVAAGVAKAGAGVILISGYDGGTGAAPLQLIVTVSSSRPSACCLVISAPSRVPKVLSVFPTLIESDEGVPSFIDFISFFDFRSTLSSRVFSSPKSKRLSFPNTTLSLGVPDISSSIPERSSFFCASLRLSLIFIRSVLPTSSSTERTPRDAMISRSCLAIKSMKFSTYSGFPANLFLSSGFWVATPIGHVSD